MSPVPTPEQTYLGLPATIYHLAGLYAGGVLVVVLAFGRLPWLDPIRADTTPA